MTPRRRGDEADDLRPEVTVRRVENTSRLAIRIDDGRNRIGPTLFDHHVDEVAGRGFHLPRVHVTDRQRPVDPCTWPKRLALGKQNEQ